MWKYRCQWALDLKIWEILQRLAVAMPCTPDPIVQEECPLTQYTYEDEIDLRDLILVIWRGRLWIILAVLVAAVAAFAYATFIKDPVYEATMSFLAPDYRLANGSTLRQADYLPLFRKESIAIKLVNRHGLALSDSSMDVERAVDRLLSDLEVKPQSNSSLVVVTLKHKDRALALDILRDYMDIIQYEVAPLAAGLNGGYLERVETALEARKSAYQTALNRLKEFEFSSNLSGLRASLDDRQTRLIEADKQIHALESTIASLEATLEQAEGQIAETPQTIVVRDILDEASIGLLAQHDLGHPVPAGAVAIEREKVNPVYINLLDLMYSSRRQLDSSKARLDTITDQRAALAEEIESIKQSLTEAERQYAMLSAEAEQARTDYDIVVSSHASALNAIEGIDYKIAVVSAPWASTSPAGPGRMMITALAVVLAGFVSVFGVLFVEYMRSGEQRATQLPTDTIAH